MKVLVTGGAGFIGSNFIHKLLKSSADCSVLNVDKLTYAGNLQNLSSISEDPAFRTRYAFLKGDIADPQTAQAAVEGANAVVNFAAESHVDRSIEAPAVFLRSNYVGTYELLEASRRAGVPLFIQISTDEVYGEAPGGVSFSESATLNPSNTYAASKAGADLLVRAYQRTYGMRTRIVRCCNNYGPYQFPEKLIPLMTVNALQKKPLPIYGDGMQQREWLHVEDACAAILMVLFRGRDGETYNVSSSVSLRNLEVAEAICSIVGRSTELITFVEDRPGHDRRYSIDASKMRAELGWQPSIAFEEGLRQTVEWYMNNDLWLTNVQNAEYRSFYERNYLNRGPVK